MPKFKTLLVLVFGFLVGCVSHPDIPVIPPNETIEKVQTPDVVPDTTSVIEVPLPADGNTEPTPLPAIATATITPPLNIPNNEPVTYPTLVYGEPLPFICKQPVYPEGKLSNRPNLQLMWENFIHDRPLGVWHEIGGLVEYNGELPEDQGGWRNACAVRMSYMLNKAGLTIPYIETQTVSGGEGLFHFYRLDDLVAYLNATFGQVDFEYNHGPSRWQEMPNKPGLIIQRFPGSNFTGHATIWNGAGSVDDSDIGGYRILFWELPCYIPRQRIK